MRAVCLVALAACVGTLPPTERMTIHWVGHGHLDKGGEPLDGFTCGEKYQTAVTGVPDAEREMRACWQANAISGGGFLGALVLVPITIETARDGGSRTLVDIEAGAIATSFLIGYIAAFIAGDHLIRAIDVYNAAVH
jgi:hypothetical protein